MTVGVDYLKENLDQLVNHNDLPTSAGAQRYLKMFNPAINSAFESVFEKILKSPVMYSTFNLLNKFELKARMLSNFSSERTLPIVALIALIEDKFNEVKILGAQDGEETDSLDYIALFHEDKLLACSEAWDQRLHEVDKNMLYIQYILNLDQVYQ